MSRMAFVPQARRKCRVDRRRRHRGRRGAVNVPWSAISRAAARNPVHAARASAPPTLMRRTPSAAASATVMKSPSTSRFTGLGATAVTTVAISAAVADARRVEAVGAGLGVGHQAPDGLVQVGPADDEALGAPGEQHAACRWRRWPAGGPHAFDRQCAIGRAARRRRRSSPRSTARRRRSTWPPVTLAATPSGSTAKPPSKSAFTGTSTAAAIVRRCASMSSRPTPLSRPPATTRSRRWSWRARESPAGRARGRCRRPTDSASRSSRRRAAAREGLDDVLAASARYMREASRTAGLLVVGVQQVRWQRRRSSAKQRVALGVERGLQRRRHRLARRQVLMLGDGVHVARRRAAGRSAGAARWRGPVWPTWPTSSPWPTRVPGRMPAAIAERCMYSLS